MAYCTCRDILKLVVCIWYWNETKSRLSLILRFKNWKSIINICVFRLDCWDKANRTSLYFLYIKFYKLKKYNYHMCVFVVDLRQFDLVAWVRMLKVVTLEVALALADTGLMIAVHLGSEDYQITQVTVWTKKKHC